ncbi:MAG: c-type cytochrome [Sandaracinaceae bacterium]|nr:c-type cytochrome [Sandaracinaceae bacterium]
MKTHREAVLLATLVLLCHCGGEDAVPARATRPGSTSTQVQDRAPGPNDSAARALAQARGLGRTLYATHCALCHGDQGEGYRADHAPAIGNPEYLATVSPEFLFSSIADGRPGTPMSAWGAEHHGPLSREAIAAIIAFMRTWERLPRVTIPNSRVRTNAARGATLYTTHCASCHGPNGDGVNAMSLNHPVFHQTVNDAFLRYVVEHGRAGTRMPAFGTTLSGAELDDVVTFVRTLHREEPVENLPLEPTPTLRRLTINPRGRPPNFTLREERFVSARAVKEALDANQRIILLDARATPDWNRAHIAGAAPFPFYDADELARVLPNDGTWIVAYCACPHAASGHVVDMLRAHGFTHTAVLDEGVDFWHDQHYPMARGEAEASPHGTQPH